MLDCIHRCHQGRFSPGRTFCSTVDNSAVQERTASGCQHQHLAGPIRQASHHLTCALVCLEPKFVRRHKALHFLSNKTWRMTIFWVSLRVWAAGLHCTSAAPLPAHISPLSAWLSAGFKLKFFVCQFLVSPHFPDQPTAAKHCNGELSSPHRSHIVAKMVIGLNLRYKLKDSFGVNSKVWLPNSHYSS